MRYSQNSPYTQNLPLVQCVYHPFLPWLAPFILPGVLRVRLTLRSTFSLRLDPLPKPPTKDSPQGVLSFCRPHYRATRRLKHQASTIRNGNILPLSVVCFWDPLHGRQEKGISRGRGFRNYFSLRRPVNSPKEGDER